MAKGWGYPYMEIFENEGQGYDVVKGQTGFWFGSRETRFQKLM